MGKVQVEEKGQCYKSVVLTTYFQVSLSFLFIYLFMTFHLDSEMYWGSNLNSIRENLK